MRLTTRDVSALTVPAMQYYADVPYHNWGHAIEVAEDSVALLDDVDDRPSRVNRGLLRLAAAWHDAGHEDPLAENFETKEHYAVHLMHQHLDARLSELQLAELEEAILGTRFNVARHSLMAVALHYGDIGNMMHEYPDFFDHTARLWDEYGRPDWETWRENAVRIITHSIAEADYELPRLGIGDSRYQVRMKQNVARLMNEPEPTL